MRFDPDSVLEMSRDGGRTWRLLPAHRGECMADDSYDGEACCPLGDVEAT